MRNHSDLKQLFGCFAGRIGGQMQAILSQSVPGILSWYGSKDRGGAEQGTQPDMWNPSLNQRTL